MTNVFKKFILKQKLKENGFPFITVHKDIIQKYRDTTRDNKNLTDDEIAFKLNRSYYCGSTDSVNENRSILNYGFLKIIKDNKRNLIIDIHNSSQNRNGRIKFQVKDKMTAIYNSIYVGGEM